MKNKTYLDEFIISCLEENDDQSEQTNEKFIGWESLITILVYQGFLILLPELKEWLKLGAVAIVLKRKGLEKKLIEYAEKKELDFPQAEKAAACVSKRLDEETLKNIVEALDK
ncbi:MAG: hypothetical protein KKF12_05995 [Proteobacteria bacterium]|nr:hypothetical protein [Desulfobacula sp.]MBU4130352.1 hypothetical protein [Pseudomonadota bacterium]